MTLELAVLKYGACAFCSTEKALVWHTVDHCPHVTSRNGERCPSKEAGK